MADVDEEAPPPPRKGSDSESRAPPQRGRRNDSDSDDDSKKKPAASADTGAAVASPNAAPPKSMFAPPSDGVKTAEPSTPGPGDGGWLEFKGLDGKQLWFNVNTKEMKYDGSVGIVKPKSSGKANGAGSDEESEDEQPAERRRRSTRRKDSDDDGDDSGVDSSDEGKKRHAAKKAEKAAAKAAAADPSKPATPQASAAPVMAPGSNSGLEKKSAPGTSDDAKSVLSPTAAAAAKKKKTVDIKDADTTDRDHDNDQKDEKGGNEEEDEDDEKRVDNGVMSIDKIVRSLTVIERHVSVILDKSQNLTPIVCEDLRQILARVSNVQTSLASKAGIDDRNEVDGLIDYPRVPWPFEHNPLVDAYRATAVKWKHDHFRYKDWHFPQYFSAGPLPPDIPKEVSANIRLPVPEGMPPKAIPVKISARDTVLDVMKRARDLAIELDIDNHVFKAFGLREFMEGNQLIFSYEYVRQNLRDGKKLELVLCKKPEPLPLPVSLQQNDLTAWYKAKVTAATDIPFCGPNDYVNVPNPFTTPFDALKHIPLSALNQPFRMKISGLDHVTIDTLPRLDAEGVSFTHMYVEAFVFHGMEKLDGLAFNTGKYELPAQNPRWMEWLSEAANGITPSHNQMLPKTPTLLSTLPRETRIAFIVQGVTNEKGKTLPLGWVVRNLVDEFGQLSTGKLELKLWPFPGKKKKGGHGKVRDLSQDSSFYFRATTRENLSTGDHGSAHAAPTADAHAHHAPKVNAAVLRVEFPTYALPVVAPLCDEYRVPNTSIVGPEYPLKQLDKKQTKRLEAVIEADALYAMTPEDRELVWRIRHHLVKYPLLLPKFLQSVKWHIPDHRHEAHRLLELWSPPMSHLLALELLDSKYPDYRVREYAVTVLRRLPDDELRLYLLQITQCLKYESYHESPLTRFLIERALMSPYEIGHHLFWHLKAELHSPMFSERYALILEEFLSHAPREAYELRKQNSAVLKLERIATLIVTMKRENGASDAEAMKEYTREVEKLNRDFFLPNGKFQIPYNPKLEATSLIVEKCRYMSSKMVPLWLVFRNADADAPPIYIIFKSGDDLRQDILTLQMLRVMDQTWLQNGQDMRMKPYACIATGVNDNHEGVGMIEVVMNSDTTSGIQLKYGGGAVGALKLDPIERFISDHNKPGKEYDHAVDNFVRSCAGYCVATYVLGIGDRHNGNIMVTKGGHLFHIDFGHFLGNFKKKFGVNRERAAFVFTPEMAYVMGGKNYKKSNLFKQFLKLCSEAFKYLRLNSIVLENMFILMVSAGMPELLLEKDIHYLRDKLAIGLPEKKADETLHAEINKSLDSTYRRIDNMIHNFKHG